MEELVLADQTVFLHWQKAMWWSGEKTLFVADTHFGKDSVFRSFGIPVPAGSNQYDLDRLSSLIIETGAERLIILGDFIHGNLVETDPFITLFQAWKKGHMNIQIDVVLGNHDRYLNKSLFEGIHFHTDLLLTPFTCQHHPQLKTTQIKSCQEIKNNGLVHSDARPYILAGHTHPTMVLRSKRGDRLRLPVMVCSEQVATLPSFGSMTGGQNIQPEHGDRIYCFGDGDVLRVQ